MGSRWSNSGMWGKEQVSGGNYLAPQSSRIQNSSLALARPCIMYKPLPRTFTALSPTPRHRKRNLYPFCPNTITHNTTNTHRSPRLNSQRWPKGIVHPLVLQHFPSLRWGATKQVPIFSLPIFRVSLLDRLLAADPLKLNQVPAFRVAALVEFLADGLELGFEDRCLYSEE